MKSERKKTVGFILILSSIAFAQKDPKTLQFPEIEFKLQKPGLIQISRGIDFYYKSDQEAPVVNAYLILKSGRLKDPKGKEGLSSLTMRLIKSGGTKNLSPENLEDRLDFLGSTISVSSQPEYSWISLWALKKNFEESWKILMDILFHPAFNPERLELEKKLELEEIRRRWDNPQQVGRLLFQDLIYGKDFPDIRRTTAQSIESIIPEDIMAFYSQNLRDKEIIIALAGDFEPKKASSLLKDSFKSWKSNPPNQPELPKAILASQPGIYLIDKEDMTQAVICMGHLGINRLDPDNVEMNVLNFILGTGGFNSRLMREIRSNRGLAYSIFGYVGADRDLGPFYNVCQTKSESAGEAIKLMIDIIDSMTKSAVSADEMETATKYELNSFIHRFDSPQAILLQSVSLKLQGYPENYLETYIPRIKKVDANKVLAMAKRTIQADKMIILVVGKKNELVDQLKALNLGKITEIPFP